MQPRGRERALFCENCIFEGNGTHADFFDKEAFLSSFVGSSISVSASQHVVRPSTGYNAL
jgi:hypothetical protein